MKSQARAARVQAILKRHGIATRAFGGRIRSYADGGDVDDDAGGPILSGDIAAARQRLQSGDRLPSTIGGEPIERMADAQVRGFVQPGIDLGGALQRAYQGRSTSPMDYLGPLSMAALNVMPGGEGVEAQALGNVARSAARSERFNWPVTTSYGKTIDMPITVNPSRGDIQRELAKAPHGDVRALRHPDGSVYLWPANEAMHVDIASNFDMPFRTRADLQRSSYLINKSDADKLGKWSNFDDLIRGIDASAQ
jgi:hypothetical protein